MGQNEHPIAYYIRKLSPLTTSINLFQGVVSNNRRGTKMSALYILGNHFTIRMDYRSLKNLLSQAIQTPNQKVFLTKLFGFTFTIVYRDGRENLAEDVLSRLPIDEEMIKFRHSG